MRDFILYNSVYMNSIKGKTLGTESRSVVALVMGLKERNPLQRGMRILPRVMEMFYVLTVNVVIRPHTIAKCITLCTLSGCVFIKISDASIKQGNKVKINRKYRTNSRT